MLRIPPDAQGFGVFRCPFALPGVSCCVPRFALLCCTVLTLARVASATDAIHRPAKVHTPPIRAVQKWNPFWSLGNADDPVPPDWYRPGASGRRMMWQMRNPLHNFTYYVIGVADKDTTRTGKHPAHVFAPDGGWNWAVARHRWCPLPFVSFESARCRFYVGWRESGNFGGKINFRKRSEPFARPARIPVKST